MEFADKYSVLISVYDKEKPEFLRIALNSILNQTIPTDDLVLVCDGPLTTALDAVIDEMKNEHPETLHVVLLEEQGDLGSALNIGIKHCRHDLIARMDSDDISRADRCERQLRVFREHSEISICSGIVEEFDTSPERVLSRRVPPETHSEILEFAKSRNPFNHPCVMYRRKAVEDAGGYKDFYLLEDYYLWIRMIQKGAIGYNLQQPVLWMRAGREMYKRRAGRKYLKSQLALFKYMKDSGFIRNGEFIKSAVMRAVSSLMPNRLRMLMFKIFMRS